MARRANIVVAKYSWAGPSLLGMPKRATIVDTLNSLAGCGEAGSGEAGWWKERQAADVWTARQAEGVPTRQGGTSAGEAGWGASDSGGN